MAKLTKDWADLATPIDSETIYGGVVYYNDSTTINSKVDEKVEGPGSATDNTIPLFNGTTGKIIDSSGKTIKDTGSLGSSSSIIPTENIINTALSNATTANSLTNGNGINTLSFNGSSSESVSIKLVGSDDGLTLSASGLQVTWAGSGGDFGVADAAARSDHTHSSYGNITGITDPAVAGEGLANGTSGNDVVVKKLAAGTNISLTNLGNSVQIDSTGGGGGTITGITDSGSGIGLANGTSGTDVVVKKLQNLDGKIYIASTGNQVSIENNGLVENGISKGTGEDIYWGMDGNQIGIKSVAAGSNITVTNTGDQIEIGTTGVITNGNNIGSGTGTVFKTKTGSNLDFKNINAGSGISVTNGTNDVTIAAAGITTDVYNPAYTIWNNAYNASTQNFILSTQLGKDISEFQYLLCYVDIQYTGTNSDVPGAGHIYYATPYGTVSMLRYRPGYFQAGNGSNYQTYLHTSLMVPAYVNNGGAITFYYDTSQYTTVTLKIVAGIF